MEPTLGTLAGSQEAAEAILLEARTRVDVHEQSSQAKIQESINMCVCAKTVLVCVHKYIHIHICIYMVIYIYMYDPT